MRSSGRSQCSVDPENSRGYYSSIIPQLVLHYFNFVLVTSFSFITALGRTLDSESKMAFSASFSEVDYGTLGKSLNLFETQFS